MTMALVPAKADRKLFLQVFNRLAVALREPEDDTGVTQQVYYDALADLPWRAIEAGATSVMREAGRRFFPTTAEWRTAAEKALETHLRAVVLPPRTEPWHMECADCDDTGWQRFECTGDASCGRAFQHAAHTYVRVCSCRPTNRTWARHQQFGYGA